MELSTVKSLLLRYLPSASGYVKTYAGWNSTMGSCTLEGETSKTFSSTYWVAPSKSNSKIVHEPRGASLEIKVMNTAAGVP